MASGYEVAMYADIRRIRTALERVADSLEEMNKTRSASQATLNKVAYALEVDDEALGIPQA